jgi:hypothetical protein
MELIVVMLLNVLSIDVGRIASAELQTVNPDVP